MTTKYKKEMLNKEQEILEDVLDNGNKDKYYNLEGYDGSISLDELFEIRQVIHTYLSDYVSGSSIEGNGTNFNFTFNGKPFLMRIQKDNSHTEHWMENNIGHWSKDNINKTYNNGLEEK
jgi:hypothetical protein